MKKFRDIAEFNMQHPPYNTPGTTMPEAVRDGRGGAPVLADS